MNKFLVKNKNKKAVILDIPLFLENKMNKKKDIIVFIESKKMEILRMPLNTAMDFFTL